MAPIKIGIIGVDNCASSLLQGIIYYRRTKHNVAIGILNCSINGYTPGDIEVVSAFDIDESKVDRDVHLAIFGRPNCSQRFLTHMPKTGVAIDCIRICKLAMDRNIGGVLEAPSAYYCKYPPVQYNDDKAFTLLNDFISAQIAA